MSTSREKLQNVKDAKNLLSKAAEYEEKLLKLLDALAKGSIKNEGFERTQSVNEIKSDLQLKIMKYRLEAHDLIQKANKGDEYSTFTEVKAEEDIEDKKHEEVDNSLYSSLQDKLNITREETVTPELLKKIKDAEEADARRNKEFDERRNAVRNLIKKHDSSKKEEDPDYRTFEDNCKENETTDDVLQLINKQYNVLPENKDAVTNTVKKLFENAELAFGALISEERVQKPIMLQPTAVGPKEESEKILDSFNKEMDKFKEKAKNGVVNVLEESNTESEEESDN